MDYIRLPRSILTSLLWEESAATRILWITMLFMADSGGVITATPRALARIANLTQEEVDLALAIMTAGGAECPWLDGSEDGLFHLGEIPYPTVSEAEDKRRYNREKKRESRARQKEGDS